MDPLLDSLDSTIHKSKRDLNKIYEYIKFR